MKASTYVTHVKSGESRIRIPDSLMDALSIRGQDCLYSVMCGPPKLRDDGNGAFALKPFATVYASPLPYRAWDRLVRASFTTGPGPRRVAQLSETLDQLDLYARAIETGETWPLDSRMEASPSDIIGVDTSVVIEFPREEFIKSEPSIRPENVELHHHLRELTRNPTSANAHECVESLKKRLSDRAVGVRVDSVVPLRVLNGLAGTASNKVLVQDIPGRRFKWMSCEAWRASLWPKRRVTVEEARLPQDAPVVVVVGVDTDERLLTVHFYRPQNTILTAFEVIVPSAGLEHRWWQWLYDEVGWSRGTVIGSRSSARLDGRWGTLSVVAAFPATRCELAANLRDDVVHVVNCFRRLKGTTAGRVKGYESGAFRRLLVDVQASGSQAVGSSKDSRQRAAHHCLGRDDAQKQLAANARTDSTLRNVRLWYWHDAPSTSGYESRFGRNPFSFTRPMDLSECARLYDYEKTYEKLISIDSRARLASRLVGHLAGSHPENVVLVGAYRSGKTTLMNMVVDSLNGVKTGVRQLDQQSEDRIAPVIAVRISAAVTPPELLFLAVFGEICKLVDASDIGSATKGVAKRVVAVGRKFVEGAMPSNVSVETKFLGPLVTGMKVSLGADSKKQSKRKLAAKDDDLKRLLVRGRTADRAGLLRASVGLLRALLEEAARDVDQPRRRQKGHPPLNPQEVQLQSRIKGSGLRVVVALDEVTDSKAWGGKWAFPAWRQLIEDPDFRQARWLFSSTSPLSASVDYSPLGNAMREYNLEPLEDDEVTAVIRRLENVGEWDESVSDRYKIRPVVTYASQRLIAQLTGQQPYLLQVVCCHVFEECIRAEVPIVTGRIVKKIVKRRVLPELGDYFFGQWKHLEAAESEATRDAILSAIRSWKLNPWQPDEMEEAEHMEFTPEVQKALERTGLGGRRIATGLVPLFVMWVREHFGVAQPNA